MTFFDIALIVLGVSTSSVWMYMFGRRAGLRARPITCSCGHGYGTHKEGRRCNGQSVRPHYWRDGTRNGNEWTTCPCMRYDGPVPSVVLDEIVRGWTDPKDRP
jgi:hypothetical protein